MSAVKRNIDYAQIEELAATLPSNSVIQREMGVNINYIAQRSKTDEKFRLAIEAGRARRTSGQSSDAAAAESLPKAEASKRGERRFDYKEIENIAAASVNKTELAKKLNLGGNLSRYIKDYPELAAAIERGFARRENQPVKEKLIKEKAVSAEEKSAPAEAPRFQLNNDLAEMHTRVREALRLGYESIQRVAKHTAYDERTVRNILVKLIEEKIVSREAMGGGAGFFYYLTADGQNRKPEQLKIICSLRNIKYQTSRHLCINTGLSIGTVVEVIDSLVESGILRTEQVGSLPAYYLEENKPKGKLFNTGNNSLAVREEEKQISEDKPKIGDKLKTDEVFRTPGAEPYAKSYVAIDAGELERLASKGLKQKAIAESLGIGYSTLQVKIKENSELKAAYERGQEIYRKSLETDNSAPGIVAPEKLAEAKEFCNRQPPTVDDGNTVEEFIQFREKRKEAFESVPGVLISAPAITISMTIQIPLGDRSREFIDRIQNLVMEFQEENQ